MTDQFDPALREIVKQALSRSQHPPYLEPAVQDERGQVVSARQEPVDAFLEQLHTWGCIVVSRFDARLERKNDA